jgi:hypothetical protein
MKFILIIFFFWFFDVSSQQNLVFDWVNLSSGNAFTEVKSVTTDRDNNIYHCGVLSNTGQMNFHDEDIFASGWTEYGCISKIDSNGNFVWGLDFVTPDSLGANHPWFNEIKVAKNGDIVVMGSGSNQVDFDPSQDTAYLYAGYGADPFILRYSNDGELLWAKTFESVATINYGHYMGGLELDEAGNVFICGMGKHAFDLDPSQQSFIIEPTNHAAYVGYLVKLSANGEFIWGNEYDMVNTGIQDVHVADDGSIIATGFFYDSLRIQSAFIDTMLTTGIPNFSNVERSFIIKCDQNGNELWVSLFHGGDTRVKNIITDEFGNIYLGGTYVNLMVFDSGNFSDIIQSHGGVDLFVSKYTPDGDLIWGKGIGSKWGDEISNTQFYDGKLYIQWSGSDTLFVDDYPIELPEYTYNSIVALESDGNFSESILTIDYIYNYSDFHIDDSGSIISTGRGHNSELNYLMDFDPSEDIYNHHKQGQITFVHKMLNRAFEFEENQLFLFPNPTSGTLNIALKNNDSIQEILIIDINGKKLRSIVLSEFITEVDVSDLSVGTYFIFGIIDDKKETHRFVKY